MTIPLILMINIAAAGILLTLLALTMRLPFKLAESPRRQRARRQRQVAAQTRTASDHRAPSRGWQTILDDGS